MRYEEALANVRKVIRDDSQLVWLLEQLYPCLLSGKTLVESLEIIICSSKSPASIEDILRLLSYFPKLTASELKEKL